MLLRPERLSLAVWLHIILLLCDQAPGQEINPRSILGVNKDSVYCVAVSPDGKSLASGARDGLVVRWEIGAAQPTWTVNAHKDDATGFTQVLSVSFSPDGKTLASGGWDRAVRLWDAATGELRLSLLHDNLVYSVAFSPDGKTLASGEHGTGAIHLWDVGTGNSSAVLGDGGSVWSLAYFPDGKTLASGAGGVLGLWDLSRRTLKLAISSQPLNVAVSPDGRKVAAAGRARRDGGHQIDGFVRLWDTTTGELWRDWKVVGDGETIVDPVAFSPDGLLVAGGGARGERAKGRKAGEIYLWDVEANRLLWSQPCHDDDVTSLAFTPDGKSLVSGGRDKLVKVWEIAEVMRRASR
jgi:WD40 repeat protein